MKAKKSKTPARSKKLKSGKGMKGVKTLTALNPRMHSPVT